MPLVVPGEVWDSRYIGEVNKFLAKVGCTGQVKFLGYVPHDQMQLLFGSAQCLVFPSLLEACGTVLIEALACGTPIICSRLRPLTDVCGDAAVYFNGEDPDSIADKLHEVLRDTSLRKELSERGLARAARFSWRNGAEKMYQVFEELKPLSDPKRVRAAAD
jgi:glycosyltransferase involved in cell wall biosynthesis